MAGGSEDYPESSRWQAAAKTFQRVVDSIGDDKDDPKSRQWKAAVMKTTEREVDGSWLRLPLPLLTIDSSLEYHTILHVL